MLEAKNSAGKKGGGGLPIFPTCREKIYIFLERIQRGHGNRIPAGEKGERGRRLPILFSGKKCSTPSPTAGKLGNGQGKDISQQQLRGKIHPGEERPYHFYQKGFKRNGDKKGGVHRRFPSTSRSAGWGRAASRVLEGAKRVGNRVPKKKKPVQHEKCRALICQALTWGGRKKGNVLE